MDQLADSLKNPTVLLHIIKYEVLHKKPVYESYKNMCKLIGDDVMTYPDFEFWYMRFYNGQLEMDYDRSQDKEPLTLSELPVEIVSKVMEWLHPLSRITTRQASKVLRSIIDNQPLALKSLGFYPSDTLGTIHFGESFEKFIWYKEKPDYIFDTYKRSSEFEVDNPIKLSSIHFKSLTSNSKLKVETYQSSIETDYPHLEDFVPCCQIFAKNLKIESRLPAFFSIILPKFEPKTLESIHMELRDPEEIVTITDVSGMEQWNQAETIDMLEWGIINPSELGHFYHFVEFSLKISSMSQEDLIGLRNNLLQSPSFQKCKIQVQCDKIDMNLIGDGMEGVQQVDEHTIRIPVPNSTDVLEFSVVDKEITVERKTVSP